MTRLPRGGLIDRDTRLDFTFDGHPMTGHPGDTLASALLANGQHLVARSIKYHRPRGILSAGLEEPCAMVTVTDRTGSTPNLKATEVMLRDGLRVISQNNWPSVTHDAGSALQLGGRMLAAGFYYKTFKWPRDGWHKRYAGIIRRLAGHGQIDPSTDKALYDKRHRHCDVLVIGSGAAGLSAAQTAAHAGATTILIEQDHVLGGSLLFSRNQIAGEFAADWANDAIEALQDLSNVTVMSRTLAFGQYDHGQILAVESMPADSNAQANLWKIRARRILLASGATERPIVFPGNDRPGIMLGGAVRSYIRRFSVAPGTRAVVAVADPDEGEDTVAALKEAGIDVRAVLPPGAAITGTSGRLHLRSVGWRDPGGKRHRTACDLLCVSAGWMPNAHLFAQMETGLQFDGTTQSLLPPDTSGPLRPIGGARGILNTADCLTDGKAAAHQALAELEMHKHLNLPRPAATPAAPGFDSGTGKAFVDLQNDVTRDDVALAMREGYKDIELVKRYTTLGMGTDQGKTSWTNGVLEIATQSGRDPAEIGHTTYRPPYSPVTIGALIGTETGDEMVPTRRTPFHRAFERMGCVFQTSGDWLYARYFPRDDETMQDAVDPGMQCRKERAGLCGHVYPGQDRRAGSGRAGIPLAPLLQQHQHPQTGPRALCVDAARGWICL